MASDHSQLQLPRDQPADAKIRIRQRPADEFAHSLCFSANHRLSSRLCSFSDASTKCLLGVRSHEVKLPR
jgi:hypothetical protein